MARRKGTTSRRSGKSKSSKVKVNFSGVETRKTLPEDDYKIRVEEISKEKSDNGEYLKWTFRTESKSKKLNNAPLYYNTSLQPQALWNLRQVLEALGVEVPDDEMELDLKEYVGMTMVASTAHDDFEGKRRSVIVDFYNEDDEGAEISDDDDGDGKGSDSDETYTEDEVNEMDADELQELIDEHELAVTLKKHRSIAKKRKAVIDALEEEDLIGDGEGEEEEDGNEDGDSYSADDINDMDADELKEVIDKHELDVNLKKHRSVKKKRAAVIQALEEEDLIEGEEED